MTVDLQADLRGVIERAILEHPRSQQVALGPSEIGTPCPRKLAHKIAGTSRVRPESPAWRPTVGTAVHDWAERIFQADNARRRAAGGEDRWLTETKVDAGDFAGRALRGSSDLFDLETGTVIDWKFPGVTTIKSARAAKSPGEQYRAQAHIYGMGFARLGIVVHRVAIYFLPAAGELADGYFWSEPFDPMVAVAAMTRANGIASAVRASDGAVIAHLPMVPDHCAHCPWWKPGATDLRIACPGDPTAQQARTSAPRLAAFDPSAAAPTERTPA